MFSTKLTPAEQANKLIAAINSNDYASLEQLAKQYDVNARNENKMTALLNASKAGNVKAIEILLMNHADPNMNDEAFESRYPMEYAACSGSDLALEILLKNGGKHKDRALAWSVYCRKENCVKLMLEAGADPNTKLYEVTGRPPVIVLAAKNGDEKILEMLIKYKANIEATAGVDGRFDTNALMASANVGSTRCLNLLLKAGVNLNTQNEFGFTAVMHAVTGKQPSCLQILLEKGANPNLQTFSLKQYHQSGGDTALHLASGTGQDKCIAMLIKHHVAVNLANANRIKPMHCVVTNARSKAHGYPQNPGKESYLACAQLLFAHKGGDMSDDPAKYELRQADDEFKQYITNYY